MKHIAWVMCLVLMVATFPKQALANGTGEKGSKAEAAEFAQRQAQAPELQKFVGGDAGGLIIFILLVAAIAVLVYYLVDNHHHAPVPRGEKGGALTQLPPRFR